MHKYKISADKHTFICDLLMIFSSEAEQEDSNIIRRPTKGLTVQFQTYGLMNNFHRDLFINCLLIWLGWPKFVALITFPCFFLPVTGTLAHRKPKQPFLLSRWRQYWYAPVTSFIGNVLMYFLFLFLYAYVLLVDFKPPPPNGPALSEYVLYFWVFTIVCEEIREVGADTSASLVKNQLSSDQCWG